MKWAQIVVFGVVVAIASYSIEEVPEDSPSPTSWKMMWKWMLLVNGSMALLYFAGAFDTLVPSIWETP